MRRGADGANSAPPIATTRMAPISSTSDASLRMKPLTLLTPGQRHEARPSLAR